MAEHYHRSSPSNQRSLGPFSSSSYNNPYPGIDSLGAIPQLESSAMSPFQGGGLTGFGASDLIESTSAATAVLPAVATTAKTGFSLANIGELKGVIDRMGGIDGIVSSMGKFQKVMSSVQQMAPMIKLMMGTFGKGKTKGTPEDDDPIYYTPPKRRRKKTSSTKRKTAPPRKSTKSTNSTKRRSSGKKSPK
ncbi:hypothetical protein [Paenibacillus antarcticus]|uniref:Tyrosine protein kinase n=1 Tax=Paenibacillus antarcticus TaxID=253703 RepID=A0A168MGE9_9BACL|nr:hypothetical protein [Paenibacillus antarcticus]OAB44642.1 hypothetical protein PBAT_15375 [Paenibacillus antarcticus]